MLPEKHLAEEFNAAIAYLQRVGDRVPPKRAGNKLGHCIDSLRTLAMNSSASSPTGSVVGDALVAREFDVLFTLIEFHQVPYAKENPLEQAIDTARSLKRKCDDTHTIVYDMFVALPRVWLDKWGATKILNWNATEYSFLAYTLLFDVLTEEQLVELVNVKHNVFDLQCSGDALAVALTMNKFKMFDELFAQTPAECVIAALPDIVRATQSANVAPWKARSHFMDAYRKRFGGKKPPRANLEVVLPNVRVPARATLELFANAHFHYDELQLYELLVVHEFERGPRWHTKLVGGGTIQVVFSDMHFPHLLQRRDFRELLQANTLCDFAATRVFLLVLPARERERWPALLRICSQTPAFGAHVVERVHTAMPRAINFSVRALFDAGAPLRALFLADVFPHGEPVLAVHGHDLFETHAEMLRYAWYCDFNDPLEVARSINSNAELSRALANWVAYNANEEHFTVHLNLLNKVRADRTLLHALRIVNRFACGWWRLFSTNALVTKHMVRALFAQSAYATDFAHFVNETHLERLIAYVKDRARLTETLPSKQWFVKHYAYHHVQ